MNLVFSIAIPLCVQRLIECVSSKSKNNDPAQQPLLGGVNPGYSSLQESFIVNAKEGTGDELLKYSHVGGIPYNGV